MMAVLSEPDTRNHMSSPPDRIDWLQLQMDLRGVRIGLLLELPCGIPLCRWCAKQSKEWQGALWTLGQLYRTHEAVDERGDARCHRYLLADLHERGVTQARSGRSVEVAAAVREWAESAARLSAIDGSRGGNPPHRGAGRPASQRRAGTSTRSQRFDHRLHERDGSGCTRRQMKPLRRIGRSLHYRRSYRSSRLAA